MTRHPLDALSLLFGLVFTAVAIAGLFGELSVFNLARLDLDWLLPLGLLTFGGALAVSAVRRNREESGEQDW